MRKNKSLDFFSIVCLTIIFLGMFSVASRGFTRVLVKINRCPHFLSKIIFFDRNDLRSNAMQRQINWKELYPFENEKDESENEENKIGKTESVKLSLPLAEKIKRKVNVWIDKNLCLRNFWINSSRKIVHILVGNMATGIITVGNDKEYVSHFCKRIDVSKQARATIELNEFLKQNGISFLYVQAPFKISPLDVEAGTIDFSNQNADEFLAHLKEGGVDFIDMREEIIKTGEDFHEFFYKTDHHWKAEIGLFACPIIARTANEMAGIEIDTSVFDPKNFNFEVFENSFLGSVGRELTLTNAKMEDITLITPKKEFDLETEIYSSDRIIRKAIDGFETFIFKEHLQTKKTALTDEAYSIYMSGNRNEFIKNNSCPNGYKILFLGDSFNNVVESFFALSVEKFDSLDLRVFDGSFKNYIKKNKPYDICVLIQNPSAFPDKMLWNFD